MARVGILGGTFDPPHIAHLVMADQARCTIPLAKVLFMPAPNPPHKAGETVTAYETRVKMVELAIAGQTGLELSRMEEYREGPSFTVDLLRYYKSRYRDEVFFIIGSDSLQDLPSWKDPSGILALATLVVFARRGFPPAVPVEGDANVILFEEPLLDISSSDIREMVRTGSSVRSFLPEALHNFILDNSLYTC